MKTFLTVAFSFFLTYASSQQMLRVKLISDCYKVFDLSDLPNKNVKVTVTRISDGQEFQAVLNSNDEYIIEGLADGDYKLVAGYQDPFNSDTIIQINEHPLVVKFCVDSKYRPASIDDVRSYEQMAFTDISHQRLVIYGTPSDYPLSARKRKKMINALRSKYGVEYEYEANADLFSRNGYVSFNRCQIYNSVVKHHLDSIYGRKWRSTYHAHELVFPLK